MNIIIDTREQRPYRFKRYDVRTTFKALATGDYSLLGHEHMVAVERKSPSDFLSSIGTGRDRFFRELDRLRLIPFSAVVVESNLGVVCDTKANRHTRLTKSHVIGTVAAIASRYGIPILFASCSAIGEDLVYRFLVQAHKRVSKAPMVYRHRRAAMLVCHRCGRTKHEDFARLADWREAVDKAGNRPPISVCPDCSTGRAPRGYKWRR